MILSRKSIGIFSALLLGLVATMSPLVPATPAAAVTVLDNNYSSLQFTNSVALVGNGTNLNDVVKYTNVTTISGVVVDAVVTTTEKVNADITTYDGTSATGGNPQFFQPNVDSTVAGGAVTFKFQFFEGGTYTGAGSGVPVQLLNVKINTYDIDSSGSGARQFNEFRGFQTYKISSQPSKLAVQSATSNFVRFVATDDTNGSGTNDIYRAEVNYATLTEISVRMGTAGATGQAYFALDFGAAIAWTGNTTTNPNSFNTPPTSSDTTIYSPAQVPQVLDISYFGSFQDVDANPFVSLDITALPALGLLEKQVAGVWTPVIVGDSILTTDINLGNLRYTAPIAGSTPDVISFKVFDGLILSTNPYTLTATSVQLPQVITFNNPGSKKIADGAFASSASADSNLTVTLTSKTPSICTVSGLNITPVANGTCEIVATQPGNATYSTALPVTQVFPISLKTPQVITFVSPGSKVVSTTAFASGATADSALTVTLTTLTPAVCTVNGLNITAVAVGTCQIRASQAGDSTFAPASNVTRVFPITAAQVVVNLYTISMDTLDSNAVTGVTQGSAGASVSLAQGLTRNGYTFGGWSLASGGTQPISYNQTPTANITVYAIWASAQVVVNLYTISMDTLDSNAVTGVTQGSAGASVSLAQGLTRNGYTFGGWSLTSGGTQPISYNQTPTANITVYAIWIPVVVPPVTTPAGPTVGPASVTTTGTTPVNLTPPVTYNGGTPSRCLVDPADNVCKQSVTLPGKGTFVLTANGSVAFTAVTGFVGTAVVQYRVTDVYGQSTESPVTVTVVAPPAPDPGPASGTTLTRAPITLTPELVNGPATLCLVDPADNVCKQSVTFPGKGTFVLNSDGTVKFTPAPGFIGELTVQLRATDEYGHSNEAPITVIVTDSPGGQNGAGNGKTPVVITPLTVIPADADICLVDPNDDSCKQVVVLANVGTWKVTAARNVSFMAAPGYVGTNTVELRMTRASVTTRAPFTVTIAKKRPPVTITIGGFNPGSPVLTKAIKAKIKAFLAAYTDYRTIECIGFTMGPTVLAVDYWLSMTRATNACGFVKKNLKSKLVQLPLKNKQETVLGSQIRRITITLRD